MGGDPTLGRTRPEVYTMKNADGFKKGLLYLSLGFVIWRVWADPSGSADTAGSFFGAIGGFVSTAIDKGSLFLKGLVN